MSDSVQSNEQGALRFLTPTLVAAAVFVVLFILYLLTLSPTFGFVDKGEMVAVASTLGIAHPTGYPTIMLLGKFFTLVLPVRDVVALNIMSALLTAAGGGMLVFLFSYLLGMAAKEQNKKEREEAKGILGQNTQTVIAGIAALLTGMTATWWGQGTGFEVYSLHCFMLPLVTLLFLRYVEEEAVRNGEQTFAEASLQVPRSTHGFTRRGFFFALLLGLSFTNHLTTILLAPPFLVWFFWRLGVNGNAFRRIVYLVPSFVLGLLPYLWLPLRASANPFFNWGNPETLWAFWRHVTGAQYRIWMFTNPDTFPQQTTYFFSNLSAETVFVGLGLVLLGILFLTGQRAWYVWVGIAAAVLYVRYASGGELNNPVPQTEDGPMLGLLFGYGLLLAAIAFLVVRFGGGRSASMRTRIGLFTLLAFLGCLFYAGGYDILEIAPYYLTAIFAVGIWTLFGLAWLVENVGAKAGFALGAVLVILSGVVNYGIADESQNTLVEDMTVNMLESLPDNAVIFSKQWDFWLAGSFYMQAVEGMKANVIVIDHELLRRSWYLDQLLVNHPEFMKPVSQEIERFRAELYKFEHDLPYDAQRIEMAYVGLIDAMIDRAMEVRPVFVTPDFDEQRRQDGTPYYGGRWGRVPWYLANRLVRNNGYIPQEFPNYRFQFAGGEMNAYTLSQYWWYVRACLDRARYEASFGNDSLAIQYMLYAKTFDPGAIADDIPALPLNSGIRAEEMARNFAGLRSLDPEAALNQMKNQ